MLENQPTISQRCTLEALLQFEHMSTVPGLLLQNVAAAAALLVF